MPKLSSIKVQTRKRYQKRDPLAKLSKDSSAVCSGSLASHPDRMDSLLGNVAKTGTVLYRL